MRKYVCIFIYMRKYVCIYIYIYIYIYMCVYIFLYTYIFIFIYMQPKIFRDSCIMHHHDFVLYPTGGVMIKIETLWPCGSRAARMAEGSLFLFLSFFLFNQKEDKSV